MNKLKYKPFPGLKIKCKKCNRLIHNQKTSSGNCAHPFESQVYKAVIDIPNTGGDRKTRDLRAKDYEEAVLELLEFKKLVLKLPESEVKIELSKPKLLTECIAMYIDFISDEGIPEHRKKHNSKEHINQQVTVFKMFIKFLISIKNDINQFYVGDVDDFTIGGYHKYLEDNYSNSTYNHAIKAMRALFDFLIEKKYKTKNLFKLVKLKSENGKNETISDIDFYDLFEVIKPIDSIQQFGKTKRNMYEEYLIPNIKLKAFTGRRNEVIVEMKWNWIYFENDEPVYMRCPNIKVNRQKNNTKEEELEYDYIPIAVELKEFLIANGLFEKRESDEYIIEPEIINRKTIKDKTSKSFTFFFKKLNRGYHKEFNYLRKNYITAIKLFEMTNTSFLREHSKIAITNKHYINEIEIAKHISKSNFRIFPKQETENENQVIYNTDGYFSSISYS